MKTFHVTGHAFVPVKVKISVESETPDDAMKQANKIFKNGGDITKRHIVPGSEDDGAVWGFEATWAETNL